MYLSSEQDMVGTSWSLGSHLQGWNQEAGRELRRSSFCQGIDSKWASKDKGGGEPGGVWVSEEDGFAEETFHKPDP